MHTTKLILLHGALGSESQLLPIKKLLSQNFQVYSLDFTGHGKKTSDTGLSMESFGRDVTSYMHDQGIKQAAFFGYSMGGYVALYLAAHQPDLVGPIITYGTKFHWTPSSAAQEVKMLNPEVIEEKVPQFAASLSAAHGPSRWKELMAKTAQLMTALGERPALNHDLLAQIEQPVMIGIGTEDRMVSIEESKKASQHLKNGQLNVLQGLKHPIEKNDPLDLAQIITDFIVKQA